MTPDNLEWILTHIQRIRCCDKCKEVNKELIKIAKYCKEITEDPDFSPYEVMDYESDEEWHTEDETTPEEHIIDRSDPNFISIK